MVQNVTDTPMNGFARALKGLVGLCTRLGVGLVLVLLAGFIAIVTAIAGLILAVAAIALRFGSRRAPEPVTSPRDTGHGTVTLDARPSPRGWTVE